MSNEMGGKEKQILYYIIIWGAWLFLLC